MSNAFQLLLSAVEARVQPYSWAAFFSDKKTWNDVTLTCWSATILSTKWSHVADQNDLMSSICAPSDLFRSMPAKRWQSQKRTLATGKYLHLYNFCTTITKPFFLDMLSDVWYGSSMIPFSSRQYTRGDVGGIKCCELIKFIIHLSNTVRFPTSVTC